MKWKELVSARIGPLGRLVERYKWILVVIVVGFLLLCLPDGSKKAQSEDAQPVQTGSGFDLNQLEKKFGKALSEISGAGEVTVVLSVKTGTRQLLAEDSSYTEEKDGVKEQSSTVVLSKGSGVEDAIRLQEIYPQFQGALVVSDGGTDPAIRLKLTEATAALTGLGADKISICNRGK